VIGMESDDVRWKQRLQNFSRALSQLGNAVALAKTRELSDLEMQGLIQAFEFTHELAWNVMKDYFQYQGDTSLITGSRDATREAFARNLISNGDAWMEMLKSRNQTSHTYNDATVRYIFERVLNSYFTLFLDFEDKMRTLAKNEE
jgi:nucleotidyltransferase substrate binding protein (TIGR01987 family)